MKTYAKILIVIVCLTAVVPAVQAEAPLAERLPAGSLAYVGWAGRSLPFDGSNLGQLLQEPALGKMLATLKKSIDEIPDKTPAHLWEIAGVAWQHPMAFSLMDISPGQGDIPMVSAVLLMDLGKDKAVFAKNLDAVITNSGVRFTPATVGQTNCRVLKTPLGPLTIGYKGNMFFLTVGEQTAQKLLAVKAASSLKADKAFIARRKGIAGDDEQMAFSIDLAKLSPLITKMMNLVDGGAKNNGAGGGKVTKIINALGLGKITSASGSTRIVDKGLHSRSRIVTPAPHRGVLSLLAGGALTDADLADAPDDAILLCASKLSAAAVYAEILSVASKIEPGTENTILKGVAQVEKELGISITKDILANLGDTWTLTSASSLGGFGTGTVLSVSVKDSAKLSAAIGKVEAVFREKTGANDRTARRSRRGGPPTLEVMKSGKVEVHYLQGLGRDMPIAPAWAISKGKLYFAMWPQVVVAAAENGARKPLIRNAAFLKLRSSISSKPATLTYINTPSIVRSFYNFALLGWTVGSKELARELRLDTYPKVDWLPTLPKIEKHLSPEISAVSADATGITIESYGSLPLVSNYISSTLTTAPITAAILVPAVQRAQVQAKRASSKANLRGIGQAIAMYQAENRNAPPGLVVLVERGLIWSGALVSPVSGRRMPTDNKGLPIGKSDYVYIVHKSRAAGNLIRCYELPANYDNKGTSALMVDGSVRWLDMATFKAMLAKSIAQ
ncbi:MAG: hypothetical protein HN350_01670 [Phycisphaerales bacterium]|jgi:hypothetical protein|nr:hypothetical protein [Phycisphaerales bacterium]